MFTRDADLQRGLEALRLAVLRALDPVPALAPGPGGGVPWLLAEAVDYDSPAPGVGPGRGSSRDSGLATSSEADAAEADRLIGLVELARGGDAEAFGMLYDHYHPSVYRFLYYRVGQVALAEDLTSETFLRAMRRIDSFTWQGKDIAAWFVTIARNLIADHVKSAKFRFEVATADMRDADERVDAPEAEVLNRLRDERLVSAIRELGPDQAECITLRFLQGLSLADTAKVLGKSEGAVKQLQLRATRALRKSLDGVEL
jgi:RNA polymerase sigma-70 factor (TIGR02952 family)